MYRKILVPLDGTKNDEVVLEHVRRLAKDRGSAVVLIQLYRVVKDTDPFMQSIQMEAGSAGFRAKEKAEAYLPELERSFAQDGIEVSSAFLVAEGPEADEIVRYAQENHCDLIALTNQAQTGLGRWFFSNIEEKVKRRSSLPVLLVARHAP
jgi:nucleotide-binding universal stress UspA family protein